MALTLSKTKKMGLIQVVFLIIASCLGIRWIPVAGTLGTSALFFWTLGILLFFIPLALMISELSLNFEEDGGVYLWVCKGLGLKNGYLSAWYYWSCNLFYYPGILIFMSVSLAYLLGKPELAQHSGFIVFVVVFGFWAAVLLNILGIQKIARVGSLSGILNCVLVGFIIVGGFYYLSAGHPSATPFHVTDLIPQDKVFTNIANLSLLMFALSGLELIPTLAHFVEDPERTLPRGLLICSVLLILFYMLGTMSINFVLTPSELNNTTGLLEAFVTLSDKLHWDFLIRILLLALVIVEFGGIILWLIGPSIMFFECVEKGILPAWLQKLNRNEIPANALIFQGIIVTLLILLTEYLPTVNAMYTVLILMAAIVYFLPYLLLSVAYFRLRQRKELTRTILPCFFGKLMAILVFVSIMFGILATLIPGSDLKTAKEIIIYELELIGGPLLFIGIGYWMYARHKITN